jgi:folate receptor
MAVTTTMALFRALLPLAAVVVVVQAQEPGCTQFKEIYTDGTDLCNTMWADSFEVVDDDSPAYTMWFFDQENNPNDDVTRELFGDNTVPDQCHLQYFHKDAPGPEDESMTECHPWKNNACCDSTTVQSTDQLNKAYGPGYEWDRCGKLSQACERFFVMEACLYECEPSAGLYRKYNESQVEDKVDGANTWQLEKMPIKKSFCDSWYTACYNDYFCGAGDYFACQAFYEENLANEDDDDDDDKDTALKWGLGVAGAAAAVGICFAAFLILREKSGKPVFAGSTGVSS